MIFYFLFLSVFILDYLASDVGVIPRAISWLPEVLSGIVVVQIVFFSVKERGLALPFKYFYIFLMLLLLMLAGVIANGVQPGAVFAGIRGYLKYIPFFFLPVIIRLPVGILEKQVKFIFILILLQVPLSIFQRFIQYSGVRTGDGVVGTLGIPSALTIVCLSAIAIILSAFYKKRITKMQFLLLVILLLIPPTINETTITLIMLPMAFLIPTILFAKFSNNKSQIYSILLIGSFALIVFGGVYDYMYGDRWGGSITNIFSDDEQLSGFLTKKNISDKSDARIKGEVGRFDSISLGLNYLSDYPTKLLIGVGMGNAMPSFSKKLVGEYNELYMIKGGDITAFSHLLWEFGVFGLILVLSLFWCIFTDAKSLIGRNDIFGVIALGWCAVVAFLMLSLVYKNLIFHNALGYLFWYFSGCIVAERYRLLMIYKQKATSVFHRHIVKSQD